jgi:hypothetical protein
MKEVISPHSSYDITWTRIVLRKLDISNPIYPEYFIKKVNTGEKNATLRQVPITAIYPIRIGFFLVG